MVGQTFLSAADILVRIRIRTMPATADHPPHVIIAGFGVPGRYVAELLECWHISYCVIELNPATAARCAENGLRILVGDVRDEAILRDAGLARASLVVLAIPNEEAVHQAISTIRRLRPDVRILARTAYTSAGLKAHQLGADDVVIAEQLVAREFYNLIEKHLAPATKAGTT
jgi:voltage-gated potassium channel Kch